MASARNIVLSYLSARGNAKQVRGLLQLFEKAGARDRVISISDARFSPASPLNRLTEKQRKAIIASYKMGYYDRPRRASSKQVARKLGLGSSTLIAHRRKAERRLLADLIGQR